MTHTFYLDESGHAGVNYLDNDQPFHVAGGVLISATDRIVLDVTMRSLLVQDQTEIKASQLMRSARGQRRVLNIIEQIGQAHVMPFFVIMERRFSIAGKLVDIFLDPEHQDSVDWLPTVAIEQRHELTERLFDELDDQQLNEFALAYKAPNVANFTNTLNRIINSLRRGKDDRLTKAFEGALRHVTSIVRAETYGDGTTKHGDWAGLNVPSFSHALRSVDRFMDRTGGTFDVVHDSALQYEAAFRKVLAMIAQPAAPIADLQLPDGTLFRGLYRNFGSFRTANSTLEPGVQAADIIAGAVAGVAKAAIAPLDKWSPELHAIAQAILPALLMTDETGTQVFAGIYAHTRTKTALLARLFRKEKPSE